MEAPLPINFANQVVPIFTKLGCNCGGCHGKIAGQNGFRLSLLGLRPGVRLRQPGQGSPRPPRLARRAGRQPAADEGDRRMRRTAAARRWSSAPRSTRSSAAGSPPACPTAARTTRPSRRSPSSPKHRVIDRKSRQQFAVYAHYTDGTVEDVTRRAQYESNDTDIATVERSGPGQHAVA